jgi:hypothetical protein
MTRTSLMERVGEIEEAGAAFNGGKENRAESDK